MFGDLPRLSEGGEVGGAGDHVAVHMFVEACGEEEVYFGVEALGGVSFDFYSFRSDVLNELEDAFFHIGRVFRLLDIGFESFGELAEAFRWIGEEEAAFARVFFD